MVGYHSINQMGLILKNKQKGEIKDAARVYRKSNPNT